MDKQIIIHKRINKNKTTGSGCLCNSRGLRNKKTNVWKDVTCNMCLSVRRTLKGRKRLDIWVNPNTKKQFIKKFCMKRGDLSEQIENLMISKIRRCKD